MAKTQHYIREGGILRPSEGLSTNYVAAATGLSLRQLQWWDERRVIEPVHEGHRRIYSREDVCLLIVLAQLRRKGMSLFQLRNVLVLLRKELRKVEACYLATDGEIVLLFRTSEALAARMLEVAAPMYIASIPSAVRTANESALDANLK